MSISSIAAQLGVAVGTVFNDLEYNKEQYLQDNKEFTKIALSDQLRAVGEVLQALTPGMQSGHPRSAEVYLKALERQAQLLGIDAPDRSEVVTDQKIVVEYETIGNPIETPPALPGSDESPTGSETV
jgi:PDZ domain-containing secreted protein